LMPESFSTFEMLSINKIPTSTGYEWRKRSILRTLKGDRYSRSEVFAAHVGRRMFDLGMPLSWIEKAVVALGSIKDVAAEVAAGRNRLVVISGQQALLCNERDTIRRDGGPAYAAFFIVNLDLELLRFARILSAWKAT